MERLYSIPDACEMLGGISPWTLYSWLSRGKATRTKVGRRTMIRETEIQRLMRDEHSADEGLRNN
jgi:predicted site-specific integrase-resolvase